jgi:hypothetical protein
MRSFGPMMGETPSRETLEAAHCWEADDGIPGRPAMTDFRRRVRYHQARWREANGHPIGTQPIAPRPGQATRLVGSRLPLDYARESGATFVIPEALDAARVRMSTIEPHQTVDHQRLWADLLWSPALAFNLFGDLAADLRLAERAVRGWWPDAPGSVSAVRFAHSPGRLDPSFLNSLRAFDTAFELDLGEGTFGFVGVDVNYHEWSKPEIPKPENLARYADVARRSGAFESGAGDQLKGRSGLAVMWLEHLLVLSMLQHPSGRWTWGRYVVIHPAGNVDISDATTRYRTMLADESTFSSMTLEQVLDGPSLRQPTVAALRDRYLPG